MKKFIKHILVFAIFFFIIDKAGYFILVKTSNLQSDRKLEKIISGGMDKELLVLGSSRGIGNLIGGQLEKETGLSTYNISYRGSDITFQEYVLKTYLDYNTAPKKLVLVIDNPSLLAVKSTLGFRYDRLYPLAHRNTINNKLIALGKHSIASRYMYALRLQSEQLKFNKVKTSNNWEIDDYGSQIVYGRSPHFPETIPSWDTTYTEIESQDKLDAFKNIIEMCSNHSIEISYVFPPNLVTFNTAFLDRFKGLVANEGHIVLYDSEKSVYRDEAYFYDVSHLNANGAKIFTSEISDYINALPKN